MSDEKKEETKPETKTDTKAETKTEKKAEKKEKPPKEIKKIHVQSQKANATVAINPHTGTRFQPGSARQLGFDIIYKGAKEGKNVKEIREILKNTRKETGAKFNMDIGYVNFVVACHPEYFEVFTDGNIKILKDPKPDLEAAKKLEDERKAKKEKALAAREDRKAAAKKEEKPAEKTGEAKPKEEKKVKAPDVKPTKKA